MTHYVRDIGYLPAVTAKKRVLTVFERFVACDTYNNTRRCFIVADNAPLTQDFPQP